jgi:iron complex transport system ATP-binding protein
VIDVGGVTVRRDGATLLDDVSLSVAAGQVVGVVGPNGAGKTTLLGTIGGTITPTTGDVTVDGRSIAACSAREAGRLVASVPQTTTVPFEFDVRTVVEMGRTPYRDRFGAGDADGDAVERAMERTATAQFADRSITTLSGGERQRVLIARALAQTTPVLALDEPTSALDIDHQAHLLGLVEDLAGDGKTVVVALHDLDLAARYCDTVVLLDDGAVVASGPPADIFTADRLEAVFGTPVAVEQHPVTGTPSVVATPGEE